MVFDGRPSEEMKPKKKTLWVLLIGVVFVVVGLGFVVVKFVSRVDERVRTSPAYLESIEIVQSNQSVISVFGAPIVEGEMI